MTEYYFCICYYKRNFCGSHADIVINFLSEIDKIGLIITTSKGSSIGEKTWWRYLSALRRRPHFHKADTMNKIESIKTTLWKMLVQEYLKK